MIQRITCRTHWFGCGSHKGAACGWHAELDVGVALQDGLVLSFICACSIAWLLHPHVSRGVRYLVCHRAELMPAGMLTDVSGHACTQKRASDYYYWTWEGPQSAGPGQGPLVRVELRVSVQWHVSVRVGQDVHRPEGQSEQVQVTGNNFVLQFLCFVSLLATPDPRSSQAVRQLRRSRSGWSMTQALA